MQFKNYITCTILMDFIVILIPFLLFLTIVFQTVKKSKPTKLPPGPMKWPIIGNMHNLSGSLPHHILKDLAKKYGPLMHLKLGEISMVIVSSSKVAKEVMKDHDLLFAYRPYLLASWIVSYNYTDIIFAPYGEYWRQLRKICTIELLSVKRVKTFQSIREDEVLKLIRSVSLHKGSAVNLSRKLFSLTYNITARAAFGKKSKYQEEYISVIEESVKLNGGFSIVDMYPSVKLLPMITGVETKLERIHEKVDEIPQNIVNEHKEKIQEHGTGNDQDLVDVLLNIHKLGDFGAPLTDTNIKAVIFDIFTAGGETTSTTMEWAMSEMINNPEVMIRARDEVRYICSKKGNVDESCLDELKYLQAVIKETLRLHPPAPLLAPRECQEKCEVNGYEIPVKAKVVVNAWAIARDPDQWNNAEKFVPERFLDSKIDYMGRDLNYIPFGAGRRICPGISFAQASMELPLAQLLFHFDWTLPDYVMGKELDMTETFGATVRRKNDLHLIPIPYSHSSLVQEL